ncbi:MAG: class I SAM-dependent methyltransferase [Gammaproteobacteria bacterium]
MNKPITTLLAVLCSAWMLAAVATPASDTDTLLHQAVAGSWRSEAHKARDQYRHPVATLEFFGLKPDMTVVELAPGGGWYTEILAPVLKDHGHLIEATGKTTGKYADMLQANKAEFGDVKLVEFSPPKAVDLGADGSADMVVTFRNLHDWLNDDAAEMDAVFQAAFKVLKQGGVLGIEEHRARPYMDAELASKSLHRIPEDYIINAGLKAGFTLGGISEINANPADDESVNVHRLMPDMAGDDAALKPIGESDRMTVRFIKPGN